jgi:hypothetical protein
LEDKAPDNEAPDSPDDASYSEKKPSAKKARTKEQQELDDLRDDLLDIWRARFWKAAPPRKFVFEGKEPDNEPLDSPDGASYSEKKPSAKKARTKEQQELDDLRDDLLDIWRARSKRKAAPRKFVFEDKYPDNEAPDSLHDASYSEKKPSAKKARTKEQQEANDLREDLYQNAQRKILDPSKRPYQQR